MRATAKMTRKEVISADITLINSTIDGINGEVVADETLEKLAVTEQSKADIKSAIEDAGIDMTYIKLCDYGAKITEAVERALNTGA